MEEFPGEHFRGLMDGPQSGIAERAPQIINDIFGQLYRHEITPDLAGERVNNLIGEITLVDPMTGLSSRRGIQVATDLLIASSRRFGRVFTVLFLDGDHFKEINDTAGHAQGDKTIETIGRAIRTTLLRPNDIAGHISGDEFVVLLDDVDIEGAKIVAKRIQQEITEMVRQEVTGYHKEFSVTVGIAQFDQHATTRDRLYIGADQAMYAARKNNVRGKIGIATRNLQTKELEIRVES